MTTPQPTGFKSTSAIAHVCDSLKIRKNDAFHDTHWSWQPPKRKKTARAELLSKM